MGTSIFRFGGTARRDAPPPVLTIRARDHGPAGGDRRSLDRRSAGPGPAARGAGRLCRDEPSTPRRPNGSTTLVQVTTPDAVVFSSDERNGLAGARGSLRASCSWTTSVSKPAIRARLPLRPTRDARRRSTSRLRCGRRHQPRLHGRGIELRSRRGPLRRQPRRPASGGTSGEEVRDVPRPCPSSVGEDQPDAARRGAPRGRVSRRPHAAAVDRALRHADDHRAVGPFRARTRDARRARRSRRISSGVRPSCCGARSAAPAIRAMRTSGSRSRFRRRPASAAAAPTRRPRSSASTRSGTAGSRRDLTRSAPRSARRAVLSPRRHRPRRRPRRRALSGRRHQPVRRRRHQAVVRRRRRPTPTAGSTRIARPRPCRPPRRAVEIDVGWPIGPDSFWPTTWRPRWRAATRALPR